MSELLISRHDHALQLTLDRPQTYNALNNALPVQIVGALENAVVDVSTSVCMISSNIRYFVTGADLNEIVEEDLLAIFNDIRPRLWTRIDTFNKPLIAMVSGYALDTGCELTLLRDLVIVGDNARFDLPEITLDTMPGAGDTQQLIHCVGKALASRTVLSGESIDAEQAQRVGLVSGIHPANPFDKYALKPAAAIARHSPLALRATKQSLRTVQEVDPQTGLMQERQLFTLLSGTEDRCEGVSAFLDKHTPKFKGR